MAVTISGNLDGVKNLLNQLKTLKEKAVYVGVPQEKNVPLDEGKLNLATLAMILQRGTTITPKNGKVLSFGKGKKRFFAKKIVIEPRPFIEQTINENKQKYIEQFAIFIQQGQSPIKAMNLIALMAENDIKEAMKDKSKWVPNSPVTIALKGSSSPLIDSGNLRSSITGIVK